MLNERQEAILSYIREHGTARNSDLHKVAGNCSQMTLWRDLTKLEQENLITRSYGTVSLLSESPQDAGQLDSFSFQSQKNVAAKEEIAKIASEVFQPDHAYYFDAGSTLLNLVHALPDRHYVIVTSAANTAVAAAARSNWNITLLGGQFRRNTLSCSGTLTESLLQGINIDAAVMATSGYSKNGGFSCGHAAEASLKREVIQKAAFRALLIDDKKIGVSFPFSFASLDDFDLIIGSRNLPDSFLQSAADRGVMLFHPEDGRDPEERLAMTEELFSRKMI